LIGLSTSYYGVQGFSIKDSVSKIVEMGFDTVELGAAHEYESDVWKSLRNVRNDFPEIIFTVHSLFPPLKDKVWFNPADGLTLLNKIILDNLFRSAEILGSSVVGIHPPILSQISIGHRVAGNFELPIKGQALDANKSFINYIELMKYADELAYSHKMKILIENMDTGFVNSNLNNKADFEDTFERFHNSGLLLDAGHAVLCGNLKELITLSNKVYELHIHDTGDIKTRGRWGHSAVKDTGFYDNIRELILNENMPIIFEHGSDVFESEILSEKKILEHYIEQYAGA
jgi:sugar phosphate isomerase/epimerase